MKFFRLDLLTLLISLFILNSCKNQDAIGLGVNASNQLNGSLIDTSTIVVNTIPDDSVATSALAKTPLSYFKDPVFGTTESNVAIDLNLPNSTAFTLPTGTTIVDSALLVLRYAPGFYGDSIASRYKVNVYQLSERMFSGSVYPSNKIWKYDSSTLLGTSKAPFVSRTNDSVSIVNPVAGKADTLVKLPAQLRIPISKSFINSILYNASSAQLSSNLVFKNNVKGLYVTLDKTQTGAGGTFMLALDSATQIQIYYRTINGSAIDTAVISLPSTLHAAEIKHTYSTTIKTELSNTAASRKMIYFQGLSGLRTKIAFPFLKNITQTLGAQVVVNRAELVITANPGTTIPFAPLPKLVLYRYDLANQRILVQDAAPGDPRSFGVGSFGGFYDPTTQQYHFLVTAYVQDVMRGANTDAGLFISPVENDLTGSIAPTAQIDGRTIAVGSDKTSPYRIKLNIIYTKLFK